MASWRIVGSVCGWFISTRSEQTLWRLLIQWQRECNQIIKLNANTIAIPREMRSIPFGEWDKRNGMFGNCTCYPIVYLYIVRRKCFLYGKRITYSAEILHLKIYGAIWCLLVNDNNKNIGKNGIACGQQVVSIASLSLCVCLFLYSFTPSCICVDRLVNVAEMCPKAIWNWLAYTLFNFSLSSVRAYAGLFHSLFFDSSFHCQKSSQPRNNCAAFAINETNFYSLSPLYSYNGLLFIWA